MIISYFGVLDASDLNADLEKRILNNGIPIHCSRSDCTLRANICYDYAMRDMLYRGCIRDSNNVPDYSQDCSR